MPFQLEGLRDGSKTPKRRKVFEHVTKFQRRCRTSTFGKNAINVSDSDLKREEVKIGS
jgi:hypothetical protein